MADMVLILGDSGTGKSTSLEKLNPETTFIINVTGKPLPIKGWKNKYSTEKRNYYVATDHTDISNALAFLNTAEFKHITTIVLDDFQYVMSFEFMKRAREKGFDKFTEMAKHVFDLINKARTMRDGLTVVFLSHSHTERSEGGISTRMKTIGKLLDEKITLEGLFTVVLVTGIDVMSKDLRYYFVTQNDGTTTAKSPKGMFESMRIPNDLNYVLEQIHIYNHE